MSWLVFFCGHAGTGKTTLAKKLLDPLMKASDTPFCLLDKDTLYGGSYTTTAIYSGARWNYSIVQTSSGVVQVTDLRTGTPNGVSTDSNIASFQFSNRTETLAQLLGATVELSIERDYAAIGITQLLVQLLALFLTPPEFLKALHQLTVLLAQDGERAVYRLR